MNDLDAAWLAGLLEGEGCFTTTQTGQHKENRRPAIIVAMSDEDVIRRAATIVGGLTVYVKNTPAMQALNRKPIYTFKAYGVRALEVMEMVRPYMGQRRGQKIDELFETFNGYGAWSRS